MVAHCLAEWKQGEFLGRDDEACLKEAAREGLTLVTYDRRTIPVLLKAWARAGQAHGGVILIDERTISPGDIGGLVRALRQLVEETGMWDWRDRVCMLRRYARKP